MPQRRGRGEGSIRQRRRTDGSVFWEARVSIDSKQRSFYDDTKTGAAAKARAAKVDSERGVIRPLQSVTVQHHLEQWIEGTVKKSLRFRTYQAYKGHVDHYIVPALGNIKLTELAPGHVRNMLADVIAGGQSETTARRVRATLSAALKSAMQDMGLPRNAASLAKVPKSDRPVFKPEVITPDDARRILKAFRGSRLEPLVMFAVATGLRQGEMLALKWSDIDLERGTLTVRHTVEEHGRGVRILTRPKTEKAQRTLALGSLALRALDLSRAQAEQDRLLAGDAWQGGECVFANPVGGLRCGSAVTNNFKLHLSRHGLAPIRWHALRRVFAAVLQDQGVSLVRVRDLMGHSELRVTEGYAYTMPESLLQAMGTVDDVFVLNTPEDEEAETN